MAIIPWNKKYRETLSVMLERFRRENPKYQESKITYAGRLDPLAEGLVILLTDDDVHKKENFLDLDKVYQVQFIFGFETDSYDLLGLVNRNDVVNVDDANIKHAIKSLGKITQQQYPPYSSKPVNGKPLWQRSREGENTSKIAPIQKVQVYNTRYISSQGISVDEFNHQYIQTLNEISGDFRQQSIIDTWQNILSDFPKKNIKIWTAEFYVSSGTYIRSLIHQLGKDLQTGATCIKIKRTQVGDYRIE